MSTRRTPVRPTLKRPAEDKESTRRGVALMILLMFAAFGLFNLFTAVSGAISNINFIEAGRKVDAAVDALDVLSVPRIGGLGSREANHARVSFTDAAGAKVVGNISTACGRRCPATGSTVRIAYDAAQPPTLLIDDMTHIWGGPLESLLIATIALLCVPVAYLYTRPPRKDLAVIKTLK